MRGWKIQSIFRCKEGGEKSNPDSLAAMEEIVTKLKEMQEKNKTPPIVCQAGELNKIPKIELAPYHTKSGNTYIPILYT